MFLESMTSPHPLAAWVERAHTDQPRRTSAERLLDADREADDLDVRRRRRRRAHLARETRRSSQTGSGAS